MNITVLIADDHAIVREGLRYLLEAQGNIKVIGEAANGREAIKKVKEFKPDIVIMDIVMAELNGIEATERICQDHAATRVIMLSMRSSPEPIMRSLKAGASGYLLKESAGRELVNAIYAVHAGQRYLSSKVTDRMIGAYLHQEEGLKDPLAILSQREREVLQLVVEGKTSAGIAEMLFLSIKTVKTYRSRLMVKLGIKDIPSLIKFAIQHGLTTLD